jgi:hypothetical protein
MKDTNQNTNPPVSHYPTLMAPARVAPGEAGYNLLKPPHLVIAFQFWDVFGNPFVADCLLESPNGTLEDTRLNASGMVRCAQPESGLYQVHFPRLLSGKWITQQVQQVEESPVSALAALELHYAGLKAGADIRLSLYYLGQEDIGDPPICELHVNVEAPQRLEEGVATAQWDLSGLPCLEPGDMYQIVFTAETDTLFLYSENALTIKGPEFVPTDFTPDPDFLNFDEDPAE